LLQQNYAARKKQIYSFEVVALPWEKRRGRIDRAPDALRADRCIEGG
jgi:hypothetical protein